MRYKSGQEILEFENLSLLNKVYAYNAWIYNLSHAEVNDDGLGKLYIWANGSTEPNGLTVIKNDTGYKTTRICLGKALKGVKNLANVGHELSIILEALGVNNE